MNSPLFLVFRTYHGPMPRRNAPPLNALLFVRCLKICGVYAVRICTTYFDEKTKMAHSAIAVAFCILLLEHASVIFWNGSYAKQL